MQVEIISSPKTAQDFKPFIINIKVETADEAIALSSILDIYRDVFPKLNCMVQEELYSQGFED